MFKLQNECYIFSSYIKMDSTPTDGTSIKYMQKQPSEIQYRTSIDSKDLKMARAVLLLVMLLEQ